MHRCTDRCARRETAHRAAKPHIEGRREREIAFNIRGHGANSTCAHTPTCTRPCILRENVYCERSAHVHLARRPTPSPELYCERARPESRVDLVPPFCVLFDLVRPFYSMRRFPSHPICDGLDGCEMETETRAGADDTRRIPVSMQCILSRVHLCCVPANQAGQKK
jgi:hypothetical protein